MQLSAGLISVALLLAYIPELNKNVDVHLDNTFHVTKFRTKAATLLFVIGALGLVMNWF